MIARETVANLALSGSELKQVLSQDFLRLLANEGLLSEHIAYGRVSYTITLQLHLDNPLAPKSESRVDSRDVAHNDPRLADTPDLAVVEPAPLAEASKDSVVAATRVKRNITSPNAERLRTGQPVPVNVKQSDGTTTTERITYPPDERIGEGDVEVEDATPEAKANWGVLDKPQSVRVKK